MYRWRLKIAFLAIALTTSFGSYAGEHSGANPCTYWLKKTAEYVVNIPTYIHPQVWVGSTHTALLKLKTKRIQGIQVPLKDLHPMHKIFVPESKKKTIKRMKDLNEVKNDIISKGVLDFDLQAKLLPSVTRMEVISDGKGRFYLREGNSRLNAIKRVFKHHPDLLIEVNYRVVPQSKLRLWLLKTLLKLRGLSPKDDKVLSN